jgi:hypothetical protein
MEVQCRLFLGSTPGNLPPVQLYDCSTCTKVLKVCNSNLKFSQIEHPVHACTYKYKCTTSIHQPNTQLELPHDRRGKSEYVLNMGVHSSQRLCIVVFKFEICMLVVLRSAPEPARKVDGWKLWSLEDTIHWQQGAFHDPNAKHIFSVD